VDIETGLTNYVIGYEEINELLSGEFFKMFKSDIIF